MYRGRQLLVRKQAPVYVRFSVRAPSYTKGKENEYEYNRHNNETFGADELCRRQYVAFP